MLEPVVGLPADLGGEVVPAVGGDDDEPLAGRSDSRLTVEEPVDRQRLGEGPPDARHGEVVVTDR